MSNTLYLDCFSGLSGDMLLGALINAGLPLERFGKELEKLGIASEYRISATKVQRGMFEATQFGVEAFVVDEGTYTRKTQKIRGALASMPERAYREVVSGPKGATHKVQTAPVPPQPSDDEDGPALDADARHTRRLTRSGHAAPVHRSYVEVRKIISVSELAPRVKDRALKIFEMMAEAEARVHGTIPEMVVFHGAGAIETIVEVVGIALGLEILNVSRIVSSPLPLTRGQAKTTAGVVPIPSPAVTALLEGVPVVGDDRDIELVTPTGAALVKALASEFGRMPPMLVTATGFGAGSQPSPGLPNALRVVLGDATRSDHRGFAVDEAVRLSATIEEGGASEVAYVLGRLANLGVHDAFTLPVTLSRGRPGVLLEAVVPPELAAQAEELLLAETGALAVERAPVRRTQLPRELVRFASSLGECRVQVSRRDGAVVAVNPDPDDCAAIARRRDLSLRDVVQRVRAEASAALAKQDALRPAATRPVTTARAAQPTSGATPSKAAKPPKRKKK